MCICSTLLYLCMSNAAAKTKCSLLPALMDNKVFEFECTHMYPHLFNVSLCVFQQLFYIFM